MIVQNPPRKARELKNRQEDKEDDEGYSHYKHEDYSYIDLYKKAFEIAESPADKKHYYSEIAYFEAHRDYHQGSIKEFKTLKQIGTPDHELNEAKWDLFKISMSDIVRNSFITILNCEYSRLPKIDTFLINHVYTTYQKDIKKSEIIQPILAIEWNGYIY